METIKEALMERYGHHEGHAKMYSIELAVILAGTTVTTILLMNILLKVFVHGSKFWSRPMHTLMFIVLTLTEACCLFELWALQTSNEAAEHILFSLPACLCRMARLVGTVLELDVICDDKETNKQFHEDVNSMKGRIAELKGEEVQSEYSVGTVDVDEHYLFKGCGCSKQASDTLKTVFMILVVLNMVVITAHMIQESIENLGAQAPLDRDPSTRMYYPDRTHHDRVYDRAFVRTLVDWLLG